MRDEVLGSVACVIQATGADGKRYDMVCLPDDMLHGWLFGVSADRIRSENRERLLHYKRECYRVLHAVFTGDIVNSDQLAALEARLTTQIAELRAQVVQTAPAQALLDKSITRFVRQQAEQAEQAARDSIHPQERAILAALAAAEGGPMGIQEIRGVLRRAGMPITQDEQVKHRLQRMARRGQIYKHGRAMYGLYPPAEEQIPHRCGI